MNVGYIILCISWASGSNAMIAARGTFDQVAWAWLWENIEGLLSAMLGKPKLQEEALEQYFAPLDRPIPSHSRAR